MFACVSRVKYISGCTAARTAAVVKRQTWRTSRSDRAMWRVRHPAATIVRAFAESWRVRQGQVVDELSAEHRVERAWRPLPAKFDGVSVFDGVTLERHRRTMSASVSTPTALIHASFNRSSISPRPQPRIQNAEKNHYIEDTDALGGQVEYNNVEVLDLGIETRRARSNPAFAVVHTKESVASTRRAAALRLERVEPVPGADVEHRLPVERRGQSTKSPLVPQPVAEYPGVTTPWPRSMQ